MESKIIRGILDTRKTGLLRWLSPASSHPEDIKESCDLSCPHWQGSSSNTLAYVIIVIKSIHPVFSYFFHLYRIRWVYKCQSNRRRRRSKKETPSSLARQTCWLCVNENVMELHLANSSIPRHVDMSSANYVFFHLTTTQTKSRRGSGSCVGRFVGMLIRFVQISLAQRACISVCVDMYSYLAGLLLLINMQGQFSINLNLNFIIYLWVSNDEDDDDYYPAPCVWHVVESAHYNIAPLARRHVLKGRSGRPGCLSLSFIT